MDPGHHPAGVPSPGTPAGAGSELGPLLRRSARGDRSAFAELYDATSRRVYGLVLRVVRDPAQAEEVTQDAYLEVWRTASRYDEARGSAVSWMLTIAHRKAVDHHRANGRRPQPVPDPQPPAADAPEPDSDVWALVGALPPKQRAAVTLRYACDLPHAEIAAALDCSPEAARRSLHEGLKRLRKELA